MWPSWLGRQIVALKVMGSNPIIHPIYAGMAELADALDLGSSVPDVRVQVSLSAPRSLDFFQSKTIKYGDIAQFGRATHLHCVGQRFDPAYLHH